MQRLFSTFPAGRIGVALLLLRFVVAGALLYGAVRSTVVMHFSIFLLPLVVIVMLCLAVGMMTPMVAGICCVLDIVEFLPMALTPLLLVVSTAIILALLGPGAYSVDALLFGRRLIKYTPRR